MIRIALIPVYNEESTLLSVLESVSLKVDLLVIVDDGSSDSSLRIAMSFAQIHRNVEVLQLERNRGMSAALREGFLYLAARVREGTLDPEDVLLTLDADGQHDSSEIEALCLHLEKTGLDVALTRRDFTLYPAYKRLGNLLMTFWGSLWSGHRYADVESGFRAMRLKVLLPLLEYYTGCRYSCAQEIAILTTRLGFRVDNRFVTFIRLYRSQTSVRDVVTNACLGFWAFLRWALGLRVGNRQVMARRVPPPEPC
jgi:glycosyltransferase involved in cell wall biosynthesis